MGDSTLFERVFNLPKPQCCGQGDCCKGASPSVPFHQLWAKAANGDEFARGFLSIFQPYASHDAARAVVPGLVERTLKAAAKSDAFQDEADVVFYRCRYLLADNRCGVYEDRPQFCRDYPDTPFVVMAPGCAYEDWGQACRAKYHAMKEEVAHLQELKTALEQAKATGSLPSDVALPPTVAASVNLENLSAVLSLTSLYLASPLTSFWL